LIFVEQQVNIHENYQDVFDSLIVNLGKGLSLDEIDLTHVYQLLTTVDDSAIVRDDTLSLFHFKKVA